MLVGLGRSKSPLEVIALLTQNSKIKVHDLQNRSTCSTMRLGKMLGSGRNGKVYMLDDQEHRGVYVVIKQVSIKDSWSLKGGFYLLDSTMSEIVMSSFFHNIYDGVRNSTNPNGSHAINFPYCEGFFACGDKANLVIEELTSTFGDFLTGGFTLSSNAGKKLKIPYKHEIFENLFTQLLFGIGSMQHRRMMHNDLHIFNIMLIGADGHKSYKGKSLGEKSFTYVIGNNIYQFKNHGVILKIVDFDFSVKFSEPKICPSKVFNRKKDDWNISPRYADCYDILTTMTFLLNSFWLRYPRGSEYDKTRAFLIKFIDFFMPTMKTKVTTTNTIETILQEKGYGHWKSDDKKMYDKLKKYFSMVDARTFRPIEKYASAKCASSNMIFEFLILVGEGFKVADGSTSTSLCLGKLT
tara:strand:- start:1487 stop:2713 length:1227 start_codon:yes stop_codon:yes gene_type:complete